MYSSFLIINREIFTDKHYRDNLTNDDIIAYLLLSDRMKVSQKNHWLDHKIRRPFIYYKITNLAHDLRLGRSKTIRILKKLEKIGLIIKRRMFKEPTHIFLPKFQLGTTESPELKLQSKNKINNNKLTKINTCINTEKTNSRQKPTQKVREPENKSKQSSYEGRDINSWMDTVTKRGGLSPDNALIIARIANKDFRQAHHLYHVISKERCRVAKASGLYDKYGQIRFEDIDQMDKTGFSNLLSRLNRYIQDPTYKKVKPGHYIGYVIRSVRRFFIHLFIFEKYHADAKTLS